MSISALDEAFDPWAELARYRERYDIEDRLGTLHSLERTMNRRRARLHALQRRAKWLADELEETDRRASMVQDEITGSLQAGRLLIRELLDEIRVHVGEAWLPVPIRAYRTWQIEGNVLKGAKVAWPRPVLSAGCLWQIDGEDIPHARQRCGTPACGIYALKELKPLLDWLDDSSWESRVVGVVALSGKVVEHETGYRAQHARALAVVAQHGDRHVKTSVGPEIDHLFRDAPGAIAAFGSDGPLDSEAAIGFLREWKEVDDLWT